MPSPGRCSVPPVPSALITSTAGTGRRPRCCPSPSATTEHSGRSTGGASARTADGRLGQIVPAKGLDPVEGALVVTGSAWHGLPVAGRALAAWGRIADHHERLLSAHSARPLAAAVNRLVAYRAGGRATFAEAAGRFRVPEQEVRRADRAVRLPLALGPDQPW